MIKLTEQQAYTRHANDRVRIVWNPQVNAWFVYLIDDDRVKFQVERLELHTVGIFAEIKPPFAPEGSPSFVGTIAAHSVLPDDSTKTITSHEYYPAKLFVGDSNDGVEFTHGKRVLVDGKTMICKLYRKTTNNV